MSICPGQRNWIAFAGAAVLLASLGCGSESGIRRNAITGTVTREGFKVDEGNVMFIPDGGGGPATAALIKLGKYEFTEQDGVPAGSYKVVITQVPLRDPSYKGKRNEAPLLEDGRFEGTMPPNGWIKEAVVVDGQKDPIDFEISETDGGESSPGGNQRRGG